MARSPHPLLLHTQKSPPISSFYKSVRDANSRKFCCLFSKLKNTVLFPVSQTRNVRSQEVIGLPMVSQLVSHRTGAGHWPPVSRRLALPVHHGAACPVPVLACVLGILAWH